MLWHFKPDEFHFHKFAFWIKWFLLDIIVVKALLLTYEHIFKLQSSYVNVQVCIKFWCSFSLCEILVVSLWVVVYYIRKFVCVVHNILQFPLFVYVEKSCLIAKNHKPFTQLNTDAYWTCLMDWHFYAPRNISGEHIVAALSVRPSGRPSVRTSHSCPAHNFVI